jgi:hypothetical protein
MSNPAWHSTVWQTYDYDLDVNGSYYGARKGCEPLHVQASLADWSVAAVNHTTAAVSGATVTARLYDLTGQQLGSTSQQSLDIAASAMSPAFTVAFDDSLPALHLLRLELRDSRGELLSENTYWRYRADTDMQALSQLASTRVVLTARREGSGMTATVRNTGIVVAAMVRLSLRDARTGDRILPAQYSENYFWLLPGESREVQVSWPDGQPRSGSPALVAEGYNVPVTNA